MVEVGDFEFTLRGATPQHHDGIGLLQGSFHHEPMAAAPEEQCEEEGCCEEDGGEDESAAHGGEC